MTQTIDKRLTPAAIALRLAESADFIGGPDCPNYERSTCLEIVDSLSQDPPDLKGAMGAALEGVQHA